MGKSYSKPSGQASVSREGSASSVCRNTDLRCSSKQTHNAQPPKLSSGFTQSNFRQPFTLFTKRLRRRVQCHHDASSMSSMSTAYSADLEPTPLHNPQDTILPVNQSYVRYVYAIDDTCNTTLSESTSPASDPTRSDELKLVNSVSSYITPSVQRRDATASVVDCSTHSFESSSVSPLHLPVLTFNPSRFGRQTGDVGCALTSSGDSTNNPLSFTYADESLPISTSSPPLSGASPSSPTSGERLSLTSRSYTRVSPYERLPRLQTSYLGRSTPKVSWKGVESFTTDILDKSQDPTRTLASSCITTVPLPQPSPTIPDRLVEDTTNRTPNLLDGSPNLSSTPLGHDRQNMTFPTSQICNQSPVSHTEGHRFFRALSGSSFTSDDLMLDMDMSWSCGTPDFDSSTDMKLREDRYSRTEPHVYTVLESVTEVSSDDLTKMHTASGGQDEQPSSLTATRRSSGNADDFIPGQDSIPAICTCSACPKCSTRRMSVSMYEPISRSKRPLRRLRSLPGRSRSGSCGSNLLPPVLTLNEADGTVTDHLGAPAYVLPASDQRQMVQEIQSLKLVLLKLRRLLTQDQLHLPLFHQQLSMTEPTRKPRVRPSIPAEWLATTADTHSESKPSTGFTRARTLSEPTNDSQLSLTSNECADTTSPLAASSTSIPEPHSTDGCEAVTQLLESLSLLQEENLQLDMPVAHTVAS